jgi:hypothetical protein
MSNITTALATLATTLGAVATVRTGLTGLETTSATLPILTIHSTDDALADTGTWDDYGLTFTRQVTVEAKVAATATYPATLDTLLKAIRQALYADLISSAPFSGSATRLQMGAARFFHPAEGSQIAVLQLILQIDYQETWA